MTYICNINFLKNNWSHLERRKKDRQTGKMVKSFSIYGGTMTVLGTGGNQIIFVNKEISICDNKYGRSQGFIEATLFPQLTQPGQFLVLFFGRLLQENTSVVPGADDKLYFIEQTFALTGKCRAIQQGLNDKTLQVIN